MKNIEAKSMSSKDKNIINVAYVAVLHDTAIEEQQLLWKLAQSIHEVRTLLMEDKVEEARKVLYENDYTVGLN